MKSKAFRTFKKTALVGLSKRLEALNDDLSLRVFRTEIVDRRGQSVTAQVVQIGSAATLAKGSGHSGSGLLRKNTEGQLMLDGVRFTPKEHQALQTSVDGGPIRLPVDLDGSLVKQRSQTDDPSGWLEAGGPFVWPILAVGLLGVLLLLERITYLLKARPNPGLIDRVVSALQSDRLDNARAMVAGSAGDLARVLEAGISTFNQAPAQRDAALEAALLKEEPGLERSLTLIGAAAGIAPLLGLLGTVTGMITTFEVITVHGTGNPSLLSGGISVALITTQLGLMVAIPLLLGHAWVSRAVQRRQALLEEARTTIIGLGKKDKE